MNSPISTYALKTTWVILSALLVGCSDHPLTIELLAGQKANESRILNDSLIPQVNEWLDQANEVGLKHIKEPEVKILEKTRTSVTFVSLEGTETLPVETWLYYASATSHGVESFELMSPIYYVQTSDPEYPFEARIQIKINRVIYSAEAKVKSIPDAPDGYRLPTKDEQEANAWLRDRDPEIVIIPDSRLKPGERYGPLGLEVARPPSPHNSQRQSETAVAAMEKAKEALLKSQPDRTKSTVERTLWYSVKEKRWVTSRDAQNH